MARSLNKALLIGNLTRDPELRYTPQGSAVVNFSIATNRQWKDSQGQQKDDVTFHRVVAWGKLAEICAQYLKKGTKTYIEGRIENRTWEDKQGQKQNTTEIVVNEMIILSSKSDSQQPAQQPTQQAQAQNVPDERPSEPAPAPEPAPEPDPDPPTQEELSKSGKDEEVDPEDIPF